jgi:TonB family protein
MGIRHNIVISAMVHVMVIFSIAIMGSMVRDAEFRIPDYMIVALFEEDTVIPSVTIPSVIAKGKVSQKPKLHGIHPVFHKDEIALPSAPNDIPEHAMEGHQTITQGGSQVSIMQDNITYKESPSALNTTSYVVSKDSTKIDSSSSQYSLIRAAIEKAKTYPYIARKKKIEGTVITEFIIDGRGYPDNIKVIKSSGFEILDSAALNIISKAAPFPKLEGNIVIPITFSLKNAAQLP